VYFVFGAGGGMLADRFGPRVVTSAGMLLIAAGLLACSFAASMTTVYAAYGMGVGLGIALVYTPSIACVQPWFTRRRGLAAGLGYRRARRPHRPHADAAADAGLGRPGLPRLVCRSGLPDAGLLRALVRPELWRHRLAAARHLHGPVRRARGGRHHRTLYSGAALGNLAGPVLAGAVFDRVGSYLPVLWACIGLSALAAAACARLLASRAPSY
jgi:MFS family permease